ncbi:MAG: hypothetical protein JNK15_13565 [Planctomycetes bacterium]|nr:hypothetical protein [Planctomycetota bacterium]
MNKPLALVRTWLVLDFFGDARRTGKGHGSSLTTTIFAQSFFGLVFAALLYPDTPPVPFAAANLCLSTLLVAIGALGDESRPERRAADDHLLHTAPVSRGAIAWARASHAAFAVMLVTIGMALAPAILLAQLTGDGLQVPAYIGGACVCSGLATGTLGVVARAASRWLGPARTALLTGTVKAVLLGSGLVAFATLLPLLRGTVDSLPFGGSLVSALPPYAIARWLAAPATEWPRLAELLGAGVGLLLLAVAVAGQPSPHGQRVRGRNPAAWLLRRLSAPGRHRGLAEFVAASMWRSAAFRARVLPLLGIPAAMLLLQLRNRGGSDRDGFTLACVLLQLPAIYLPFVIAFLPRGDQPGTAWIFGLAPGLSRELLHDATWRALVTHVLLPVHLLVAGFVAASGASGVALLPAAVFAAGVAVLAARRQVRTLTTMPFTQANEPDGTLDLGTLFGGAAVLGGLSLAFAVALPGSLHWPVAAAALVAAGYSLSRPPQSGTTPVLGLAADGPPSEAGPNDGAPEPEAVAEPEDPTAAASRVKPSLRGELRAIATLYVILSVLPYLVGTVFAA